MSYSDYLPCNCPPENSNNASGKVYRFINSYNENPALDDFLSQRELDPDPDEKYSDLFVECKACGLSVFTSLDDVLKKARRIPNLKSKKISEGVLNERLGKILNTPSRRSGNSHHTWWITKDSKPWKEFKLINIDEE